MPRCFEQPELRLKLPFAAIKYSEADTGGSDPESVSIYLFLSMYLRPYYPIIDFVVLKHAPAKDAAKSQVWIFKLHEYDFYRDTLLDSLCCIWSWPVCKAVVG